MKKGIAAIVALIIGISYWPVGSVVMAGKIDDENKSIDCLLEDYLDKNSLEVKDNIFSNSQDLLRIGESDLFEQPRNMFGIEENRASEENSIVQKDNEDEEKENEELAEPKESVGEETVVSEMKNLQIPQKLDIVIDPWEMDGKGQIYSEKYVIRNGGDTAGTLTLSNLACKSRETNEVILRSDNNGLHDNEEKSLYMEMWFGDNNRIILSEQETEYQTKLKPGEELTIHFCGEVNEYASENWTNNDVKVSVVYSWDIEESLANENVEGKSALEPDENEIKEILRNSSTDNKEKIDNNIIKTEEFVEADKNKEAGEGKNLGDSGERKKLVEDVRNYDENFQKEEKNIFYIDRKTQTDDESVEEETGEAGIKIIELLEEQEMKAFVDSWKVESDYKIISAKYLIRNIGEKVGIFSLTDIVCQPKEEREIDIKALLEEVKDMDREAIYMELILENGEKVVLTQTGSEYRVELKPGEDIVLQFVGVANTDMLENWEEDSVVIDAVCSWEEIR